jgi:hypothetical protein
MATRGKPWSREEVEATVADYFHMFVQWAGGQPYSKTEHRRRLSTLLDGRTEGAIEQKHMNISGILKDLGYHWIPGYAPLGNYQELLFDVVEQRLRNEKSMDRAEEAAAIVEVATPLADDFSSVMDQPPERRLRTGEADGPLTPKKRRAIRRDYVEREARNASLGLAGEEFVVSYERWRLISNGAVDLAEKVEHISKTQGDGLGYDVLSYERSGKERLIEVKTTSFARETPFFVTQTEIDVSKEQSDCYHLFRVFEFRKAPRLFALSGAIDEHCYLDPVTFQARFN